MAEDVNPQEDPTRSLSPETWPTTVHGYRIIRKLGAGGMGVVFEAEQLEPRRSVALKIVRDSGFLDAERAKLLKHEAQTLARLKHPNIAAVYNSGNTLDNRPFIAMELVRGRPLSNWIQERPITEKTKLDELRLRLAIFLVISETVSYAHNKGVIHRDLKPSNVLISDEHVTHSPFFLTPLPAVKILDFGLARMICGDETTYTATAAGAIQGTLAYMSPEQARGNPDEVDTRTDVYSLGVILHEMLTDVLPYQVSFSDLLRAVRIICEELPSAPSRHWKGHGRFPRDLDAIALKALEKAPSRRYQSASALGEDVRRFLSDQPVLARTGSTMYQIRKLVQRHRLGFGAGVAVLLFLLTLATAMTWQSRRIAVAARRAEQEAARRQQVADFFLGLFRDASPMRTSGENLTLREVLDAGSERITRELQDQPLLQADLMHTIGGVYIALGMFELATPHLQTALRLRQELQGADSPGVGEAAAILAELERLRGNSSAADSLNREALRILDTAFGPNSLKVGEVLHEQAVLRRWQNRYAEAESLYVRAISIYRLELGDNDARVAKVISDLGVLYWAMNRFTEAEDRTREALKIREDVLPKNSVWIGESLNNLGAVLSQRGALAEADETFLRALEIREQQFGPEHYLVGTTRSLLGTVYLKMGRYEEAAVQQSRALEIHQKALGAQHSLTSRTTFRLAQLYEAMGRTQEALDLGQQTIACVESASGPRDLFIAEPLLLVARLQMHEHQFSRAEGSLKRALQIREGAPGAQSGGIAEVLDLYAELLQRMGRSAVADSTRARAHRIRAGMSS